MSSKSTIFLTDDHNEHWYQDCSEYLKTKEGKSEQAIVMEFSKNNIEILLNDDDDLVIMLNNADSELFKEIKKALKV